MYSPSARRYGSGNRQGCGPMTAEALGPRTHALSKGQLVDVEARLQTRSWDDDAGNRSKKTACGGR